MPKTTTEAKWKTAVTNVAAHRQLGQTDVYLGYEEAEFPWEFVTSCEAGSTHRLDISTNVNFTATHPSGLSFRWSFDIEPRSASGSGSYHVNVSECRRVLTLLPMLAKKQFQNYLVSCADAVAKSAQKYQDVANRAQATADALREAAMATS